MLCILNCKTKNNSFYVSFQNHDCHKEKKCNHRNSEKPLFWQLYTGIMLWLFCFFSQTEVSIDLICVIFFIEDCKFICSHHYNKQSNTSRVFELHPVLLKQMNLELRKRKIFQIPWYLTQTQLSLVAWCYFQGLDTDACMWWGQCHLRPCPMLPEGIGSKFCFFFSCVLSKLSLNPFHVNIRRKEKEMRGH